MTLPKSIESLNSIAGNYWWTWNQDSWELFQMIDEKIWNETRNPVLTLLQADRSKLDQLALDKQFLGKLEWVASRFSTYMNRPDAGAGASWYAQNYKNKGPDKKSPIAYFSAEFGIHEALPIYSGGLGVLAGDHVKSSSDLGIPMVFMGLFYKNGYFTQHIDSEGQQVDVYGSFEGDELSLEKVKDKAGNELTIEVELPERKINVGIWKAMVGINPLYLLDNKSRKKTPIATKKLLLAFTVGTGK